MKKARQALGDILIQSESRPDVVVRTFVGWGDPVTQLFVLPGRADTGPFKPEHDLFTAATQRAVPLQIRLHRRHPLSWLR